MLIYLLALSFNLLSRQSASYEITENDASKSTTSLPTIRLGEECVNGKTYRMDCNTCRCGTDNRLICSKMACVPLNFPKDNIFEDSENDNKEKSAEFVSEPIKKSLYPPLPGGKCVPGMIYEHNCRRCFCTIEEKAQCSLVNICQLRSEAQSKVTAPEDIRPPVDDEEFLQLPSLDHQSVICKPGETYKVDCNICVCDEYENLLCDKLMCVSKIDMTELEAQKLSGAPCKASFVNHTNCVQCKCSPTGKTQCKPLDHCITEKEKMMRSRGQEEYRSGYTLDHLKEKDSCNRCYCLSDSTLMCTQKGCLQYTQFKDLQEQIQFLKEQDL